MDLAFEVKRSRLAKALLVFLACLLAAACAGNDLPTLSASDANKEVAAGYFVDAGDRLKVTVFGEEALTGEFDVGTGGILAMPLLEPLAIKNMTPTAVAKTIEQRLTEGGYVLYPRVSVEILENRSFFILGEVATPGEYSHSGEMTLEQAVAKAGGFTPRADRRAVVIKRDTWSESKLVRLERAPLKIAPGDTITIREAFF